MFSPCILVQLICYTNLALFALAQVGSEADGNKFHESASFWPVSLFHKGDYVPLGEIVLKNSTSFSESEQGVILSNYEMGFIPNPQHSFKDSPRGSDFVPLQVQKPGAPELSFGFSSIQCKKSCSADIQVKLGSKGKPIQFSFVNVREEESSNPSSLTFNQVSVVLLQFEPRPELYGEYEDEYASKTPAEANQSFFVRYWYFIVPAILFMLLTSAPPDQEGEPARG
ncbi:hypothetical protein DSO57_1000096 [Entomophthora muscae]|uniref:Uncharacterized protein n=1 Tax=Entomophthora muscae TaxID=34485 RepID=A0ACC2SMB5_9FUNG|nr:hypothetical protein DSO57_1000096 [Entomophthora muscae]